MFFTLLSIAERTLVQVGFNIFYYNLVELDVINYVILKRRIEIFARQVLLLLDVESKGAKEQLASF